MNAPDFFTSSGFADVCTHCGTHRREPPAGAAHRARRLKQTLNTLLGVLLASALGVALATIAFVGLSGGFR